MSFLTIAWQYRRYLAIGLITAAFLTLYAGYSFRGVEIERLEMQQSLMDQAIKLRSDEANRIAQTLVDLRAKNTRSKEALLDGVKHAVRSESTLPSVIDDALTGLCNAGANCAATK